MNALPSFSHAPFHAARLAVLALFRGQGLVPRTSVRYAGDDLPVCYVGIEAEKNNTLVRGVGVARHPTSALFSAALEMTERYALMQPERRGETVPVRSLLDGRSAALPAHAVFWDHDLTDASGVVHPEPNVTGTAIAFDREKALAFGLYECIERDAFLWHWLQKKTPPKIDPETGGNEEVASLCAEARAYGLEPHILDITSDIPVPTVMVALVQDRAPRLSRGFSSNLDPVVAVRKAFSEAWGNYFINGQFAASERAEALRAPYLTHRYKLWVKPSSFSRFEFMLRGKATALSSSSYGTENELAALRRILSSFRVPQGVWYYESNAPFLRRLNLHAVKVIVPDLIPFYFHENYAAFARAHPRLRGKAINTFPHPFA